ncbi:hypothetical protein [Nocardia yamanashiensis]|uniref:hypothetical protein n=1 Tax=Nocardia yamanashiensis TaxID=209247 RepID=UPI00082B8E09|nr:hypothetical protein [Nocardia yamanashiensis]
MSGHKWTRGTTWAASALVAAALVLTGCDKAEEVVNKGGDTPCNEFIAQDHDKQQVTVRKYLQNDTQLETPSPETVDGAITAIDLMCRAQSNAQTPIRNADLTGILVPKK